METKETIRNKIWELLSSRKVARFPGAAGRIPNFVGAEECAKLLPGLDAWRDARVIKVNPDSPQRAVRHKALAEGKILYMAVPRLREEKPFLELDPKRLKVSPYAASSIKGAFEYGRPVILKQVKTIDLIVCGSVAVNRKGARVGKGGGYSDLEYALLRESKKVAAETPVITTVHQLQVIDGGIPMAEHDIPLNAIITPEEAIVLNPEYEKPRGLYWDILPQEKIAGIPVLKKRTR